MPPATSSTPRPRQPRWRALACADSVWRAKAEREGILDKAAAFEVEVPLLAEGGSHEDEATASMAFYARVFALKGYKMRDEVFDKDEDGNGNIINPDHDGGIRTAVGAWFEDPAAAKAMYGPIASWDTSGITNMYMLFYDRKDFNEDISRWNVSNVVSMTQIFCGATSFTGDLSCWNVGQVKSMASMFRGATSFNGDLSSWEVGQVEHMASMFSGATSFTGDLSCWDVGQVEYMNYMFSGATSFTGDLSSWNVGQVKYMIYTFLGATSFNSDLSSWEVGQVEYMNHMFDGATSFTRQLGGAWSTTTANKYAMFRNSPGTITGKVKDVHGTIE
eukprot:CAMPEP_0119471442 /NCGR_PEP_ID=MMETSP1344-20130328/3905_1 /TAXON_ID=236787 /ORGANISM="Florenciella parvula, Strain CCMP2471" /LENGTH=331 /DNA_ID=CAMNT_0007504223 /DNA_START=143 /DNA_END=1138 /DNA_ORIENTATION=+